MNEVTHVAGHHDKIMEAFKVRYVGGVELLELERTDVMEVHYLTETRLPRTGDRLSVWTDVSTPYAMAPSCSSY